MNRYRVNRPDNRTQSKSADGIAKNAYRTRQIILGRPDGSVYDRDKPKILNLTDEKGLVQKASALSKDYLAGPAFPPPPVVHSTKRPFGMGLEPQPMLSPPVHPPVQEIKQKNQKKLPQYISKIKISLSGIDLKRFKPSYPRLRDWEEFKIFAAGAALAVGMVVLGFYLGFNRPLGYAQSSSSISSTSSGQVVAANTSDGAKVEVSQGVDPNSVDRRPPAPIAPNMPARLKISSIGVNASVRNVGLLADNTLATPNYYGQVGWYERSSHPGEPGTVLMDGHYDANSTDVVFRRLHEVEKGTEIQIERGDGEVITYAVFDKISYDRKVVPMDKVFSSDGIERLNIITCDGKWLDNEKTYTNRLVVYAVRQ